MTQKRTVTTKALSAYLKNRHLSLSAAIHMLGLNQKLLNEEQVSDELLGQIARLYGMTPEQLATIVAPFEAPTTPIAKPKPAATPAATTPASEPAKS